MITPNEIKAAIINTLPHIINPQVLSWGNHYEFRPHSETLLVDTLRISGIYKEDILEYMPHADSDIFLYGMWTQYTLPDGEIIGVTTYSNDAFIDVRISAAPDIMVNFLREMNLDSKVAIILKERIRIEKDKVAELQKTISRNYEILDNLTGFYNETD